MEMYGYMMMMMMMMMYDDDDDADDGEVRMVMMMMMMMMIGSTNRDAYMFYSLQMSCIIVWSHLLPRSNEATSSHRAKNNQSCKFPHLTNPGPIIFWVIFDHGCVLEALKLLSLALRMYPLVLKLKSWPHWDLDPQSSDHSKYVLYKHLSNQITVTVSCS